MTFDGEVKAVRAVARRMRGAGHADARQLAAWAKALSDSAKALERGHRFLRAGVSIAASDRESPAEAPPGRPTPGQRRRAARRVSTAAAAALEPRPGTARARILAAVGQVARDPAAVGLTDVELANWTRIPPNSLRPRRKELVDGGWLEDSGRTRPHHGHQHTVWVLGEKGGRLLASGRLAG